MVSSRGQRCFGHAYRHALPCSVHHATLHHVKAAAEAAESTLAKEPINSLDCNLQTANKVHSFAVTNLPQLVSSELIMRRPWFVGGSDLDILGKIFQALGTPSEAQWPGMKDLPNFVEFQKTEPPPLASIVKGVSMQGLLPLHPPAATNKSSI